MSTTNAVIQGKYLLLLNNKVELNNCKDIIVLYQKEVEFLKEMKRFLPDSNADLDKWTKKIYKKQIKILSKVYSIEKQIISLMQISL